MWDSRETNFSGECSGMSNLPILCLVAQPLIRSLSRVERLVLRRRDNCWWLNDSHVDLQRVRSVTGKLGFELNLAKCEPHVFSGNAIDRAIVCDRLSVLVPEIKFIPVAKLLGSVLTLEATLAAVHFRTVAVEVLVSKLGFLQSHHALFLLKNSLSLPKLLNMLRTSLAWKFEAALTRFDEALLQSLTEKCLAGTGDRVRSPLEVVDLLIGGRLI